jgi:RNA polymerase sigma-70 factor, ECF subfamily
LGWQTLSVPPASPAERVYLDLVAAYQGAILNYLYRLVGERQLAEDLTQETYIRAFQALERLELAPEAEPRRRGFLYRIAHNVATDHLRRRARFQWLSLDAVLHVGRGDPAGDLAEREPVQRALAALPADARELLLLFTYEGMDAAEVAQVMGITPDAARKRRQRAKEQFEAAYRAAVGEDEPSGGTRTAEL